MPSVPPHWHPGGHFTCPVWLVWPCVHVFYSLSKEVFVSFPDASVHSAIVAQSFGTSVIATAVKKFTWGENYDQKRRQGGLRRSFHCIIIWDHFDWDKLSECLSEGIVHASIGIEFSLIGTRHLAPSVDSTSGNLIAAAECQSSQNWNSIFQDSNINSPKSPVYPHYLSVRKD